MSTFHSWVPSSVGISPPPNALHAGNDVDRSLIYVGRTNFKGDHVPVKIVPSRRAAYVSYNGSEHSVTNYEVLCGHGFNWIASSHGNAPAGAISSGNSARGEPLYIGRVQYNGSLTPGKVHKSYGCIFIPFGGKEKNFKDYEVLVAAAVKSSWVASSAFGGVPHGAILGGNDVDGSPIYVGRAQHSGEIIPAKVIPSKNVAYISYGGQEIAKNQFDILCNGNMLWIQSAHGQVPPGAVVGGKSAAGETLYIGRVRHLSTVTVGKVHPSHGSLYIPFNGREESFKIYEVLVEH